MKEFFNYTFQNPQNKILTIVTTIAFLGGLILPFTNQLSTDSGGWQMIAFGGLLTSVIYFATFGFKNVIPYLATISLGVLSSLFFWIAFMPLFLVSITAIFWGNAYNQWQISLQPVATPPTVVPTVPPTTPQA